MLTPHSIKDLGIIGHEFGIVFRCGDGREKSVAPELEVFSDFAESRGFDVGSDPIVFISGLCESTQKMLAADYVNSLEDRPILALIEAGCIAHESEQVQRVSQSRYLTPQPGDDHKDGAHYALPVRSNQPATRIYL